MQSKLGPHSETWQEAIKRVVAWLRQHNGPRFLIEQNRNLGDTLHLIPIIKHYRLKHPNARIAFLVAKPYAGAHDLNPDIDKIFTIPAMLAKPRIALRKRMLKIPDDISVIAPSIFPYASIWKALNWSHPNIADQYFSNAGIKDLKPLGGRRLRVYTTPADELWVDKFMERNNLNGKTLCSLEYISYSHSPTWRRPHFQKFVARMNKYGVKCISFAGKNEKPIPGSISACGVSWKRTVALMSRIHVHVGIGSGMTMMAASAEKQPKICEVGVSDSITMNGCGYAPSVAIKNPVPVTVADHVWFKILH